MVKCIRQVAPARRAGRQGSAGRNLQPVPGASAGGPCCQLAPERTGSGPAFPRGRASSPPASGTPRAVGGAPLLPPSCSAAPHPRLPEDEVSVSRARSRKQGPRVTDSKVPSNRPDFSAKPNPRGGVSGSADNWDELPDAGIREPPSLAKRPRQQVHLPFGLRRIKALSAKRKPSPLEWEAPTVPSGQAPGAARHQVAPEARRLCSPLGLGLCCLAREPRCWFPHGPSYLESRSRGKSTFTHSAPCPQEMLRPLK